MSLLKGQIIWIGDRFTYNDYQEKEFIHVVSKFNDAIIDENMIKFSVYHNDYLYCSYNVNLTRNPIGTKYTGSFSNSDDPDYNGKVECELYQNEKKYIIYGTWTEDEDYTWWALAEK